MCICVDERIRGERKQSVTSTSVCASRANNLPLYFISNRDKNIATTAAGQHSNHNEDESTLWKCHPLLEMALGRRKGDSHRYFIVLIYWRIYETECGKCQFVHSKSCNLIDTAVIISMAHINIRPNGNALLGMARHGTTHRVAFRTLQHKFHTQTIIQWEIYWVSQCWPQNAGKKLTHNPKQAPVSLCLCTMYTCSVFS